MSDSDDFGGMGPTTPAAPTRSKLSRSVKPSSRAEAGPSSKPAASGRKKGKPPPPPPPPPALEDSDVQEIDVDDTATRDDEESVITVDPSPPPATRARKPSSRAESSAPSGKAAKGKGKAKAAPATSTRKTTKNDDAMDIDEVQVVADPVVEDDMEGNAGPAGVARAINAAARSKPKATNGGGPSAKEVAQARKLQDRIRRLEAENEQLSKQLEEVHQIRETEPEALRRQQEAQYLAQIQAYEAANKELTAQVARNQPLMGPGRSSILHLITQEAADDQMRALMKEKDQWKSAAHEAEKKLRTKDQEIGELEQRQKEITFELKLEIDRNKELADKANRNPPPSVTRGQGTILGSNDPKHTEVIKFYEDLTNLLVVNIKANTGPRFKLDEWSLTCIYTPSITINPRSKSLNFVLRFCHDPPTNQEDVSSKEELIDTVHYVPVELDKETPEFVEKLGFLSGPFTFERDQLSVFLKTLRDNIDNMDAEEEEGSEGSDVSVELV
ncbi:hypothetical protein BDQ12DRAFT_676076, partial [Crucibulum laeve]